MLEQRQARIVGPVQVLEDHQRRLMRRDSNGEVEEAIEQVAPRLERRQIKRGRKIRQNAFEFGQQARQLGALISKRDAQTVRIRRAGDEILQDLHERQVSDGFVLGAMPHQHRHALCLSRGRDLIGQAGLADAGFARDQEQPPAPGIRVFESAQHQSQLAFASHHHARRPSSNLLRPASLRAANLCDESITPAGDGGDESRRLGIVAQSAPQLSHRSVDAGLAIDKDALAPDALQNFLARDELSTTLNQQA
ncbi:MAG TPA: hypothetical protein VEU51_16390 [Candidatus Acidoferrales bacterium]|nr:hypothetical protein [Candidatus Acidoferrales bacterium]